MLGVNYFSGETEVLPNKGDGKVGLLCHIENMGREMHLTPMEQQVFYLVCVGKSNCEIACLFVIVEDTVKKHISRILRKFSARNRVELLTRVFLYIYRIDLT